MNRLILLTILLTLSGHAQSKVKLSIETQGGYEYNYFKSPDQIEMNGILFNTNQLISNSVLQDVDMNFSYRFKWDKSRIRFGLKSFARVFYEAIDDSYWTLSAFGKFHHDITRSTRFLAQVDFRRVNREGLDGAQDILINPLGFTNYGISSGVEFSPIQYNTTILELFYNFRNFDAFGSRDLQFNEFGVQFATELNFRVNRLKHKYGITAYFKKRYYDTFNASDIDSEGRRNWSYIKAVPYYEYPFSKQLRAKVQFQFYKRIDNLIQRSGFNQFGPELGLKYKTSQLKIGLNASYITRSYTDIEARDNDGNLGITTQYKYLNFRINAEYWITKKMSVVSALYSRIRNTNYTDIEARSFRDYRNQYVTLGLKWQF